MSSEDVRNWKMLMALGVVLVIVGVLAVAAPLVSSVAVTAWIGASFLIVGIAQIVQSFRAKGWEKGLGHTLVGLAYALGGLLLLFKPLAGMVAFSLIIVAVLFVSGVFRIVAGFRMRPAPGWGWLAIAGAAALLAGAIIWSSFPGSALWLLGTIAGISFMMEGWALISLSMIARDRA